MFWVLIANIQNENDFSFVHHSSAFREQAISYVFKNFINLFFHLEDRRILLKLRKLKRYTLHPFVHNHEAMINEQEIVPYSRS